MLERELLWLHDRDRIFGRVRVLERHRGTGRVLGAPSVWIRALVVDRPRRDDVAGRELASLDLERPLWHEVDGEDRGQGDDEDPAANRSRLRHCA